MTQKMIDLFKKQELLKDSSTQTDFENLSLDFHIQLSKNKFIKLYKSTAYKNEYVLTINTNQSKKIVLTKSMWKIFRQNIKQIDQAFQL